MNFVQLGSKLLDSGTTHLVVSCASNFDIQFAYFGITNANQFPWCSFMGASSFEK